MCSGSYISLHLSNAGNIALVIITVGDATANVSISSENWSLTCHSTRPIHIMSDHIDLIVENIALEIRTGCVSTANITIHNENFWPTCLCTHLIPIIYISLQSNESDESEQPKFSSTVFNWSTVYKFENHEICAFEWISHWYYHDWMETYIYPVYLITIFLQLLSSQSWYANV